MRYSIVLILTAVLVQACSFAKPEEKKVRETFESYRKAIMEDRGKDAVSYVDSRTVKYYDEMLDLTKHGDSATVAGRSIIDKTIIFTLRHKVSKEEILSMDGRELLIYSINNGMVGKESVGSTRIGDVSIKGDEAKGRFLLNDKVTPLSFTFRKENGAWKLDLTSIFSVSEKALKESVSSMEMDENELIFTIIEEDSGEKPGPDIWKKISAD